MRSRLPTFVLRALVLSLLGLLAGCGGGGRIGAGNSERNCMARVMYFESNRSSDEGMLAVGTVVMNRLNSGKYPKSICGVVGQKNQFAPGVLSRPMKEGQSRARAERMADTVMRGKRHRVVGNAMFFHTAGYNFPYTNMHYKAIAGGNAFYEKRRLGPGMRNTTQIEVARYTPRGRPQSITPRSSPDRAAIAYAPPAQEQPASIEELIMTGSQ